MRRITFLVVLGVGLAVALTVLGFQWGRLTTLRGEVSDLCLHETIYRDLSAGRTNRAMHYLVLAMMGDRSRYEHLQQNLLYRTFLSDALKNSQYFQFSLSNSQVIIAANRTNFVVVAPHGND